MTDERPESLAAQAASWVPPWERAPRAPDREFQAAAMEADAEQADRADLDGSDDDFDPAFEGAVARASGESDAGDLDAEGSEAGESRGGDLEAARDSEVPEPLGPLPGESEESALVDAPVDAGDGSPTDIRVGPDLDLPGAVESAVGAAQEDELGETVDAPVPVDGDDAGDVFDAAADDDVGDDDEVDLPFEEEVPGPETETDPESGTDPQSEADPETEAEPQPGTDAGPERGSESAGRALGVDTVGVGAEPAEAGTAGSAIPGQTRKGRDARAGRARADLRTDEAVDREALDPEAVESVPMDEGELRSALEAVLLVVDEPVAEMQLAQIMEEPVERVATVLEDISARYTAAGHGFDLRRAAGGWRLYTRPEYAAYVERFVLDGQSVRLTQAALETLAVVAYKQPVTRSRISAIRGVNCDGVMRTLATRGLIEECGTEPETGAYLYRTTGLFLEKLGLNSVDQLPPLAPFLPDDVEEVLDNASG